MTTKLLVIDCKSLEVKAFENRKLVAEAYIELEEDTTIEGLKGLLENFRLGKDA